MVSLFWRFDPGFAEGDVLKKKMLAFLKAFLGIISYLFLGFLSKARFKFYLASTTKPLLSLFFVLFFKQ